MCIFDYGNIPIKHIKTVSLNNAVFINDSNINKRRTRENTGTSSLHRMGVSDHIPTTMVD
jgi:hypothetical protein